MNVPGLCSYGKFKVSAWENWIMSWCCCKLLSNWSLAAFCCAYVADIYEHSVTMRPIGQLTPGFSLAARQLGKSRGCDCRGDCNNGILNSHLKWGAAKLITCHLLTSSISVHMRAMPARSGQGLLRPAPPSPYPYLHHHHHIALPSHSVDCKHTQNLCGALIASICWLRLLRLQFFSWFPLIGISIG